LEQESLRTGVKTENAVERTRLDKLLQDIENHLVQPVGGSDKRLGNGKDHIRSIVVAAYQLLLHIYGKLVISLFSIASAGK